MPSAHTLPPGGDRDLPQVSHGLLTGHQVLGATIALFAIAGLATQALAIATGRDFVFGVVPKFNPLGTRNLQVWFGSVMLLCCAIAAALAAVKAKAGREGSGIGWWMAAGSLALLSVERMASISRVFLPASWGEVWHPELLLATATAASALVALGGAERVLPVDVRRRLGWSTLVFLLGAVAFGEAVGQVPDSVTSRVVHVVLATAGRVLELAGLATFLITVLAHVGADAFASDAPTRRRWKAADIRTSLAALILVMLAGSLVSVAAHWWYGAAAEPAYRLLFVDFEGNLPTWVSSTLLFCCGVIAAIHSRNAFRVGDRNWMGWLAIGTLFAALSADEAASLHELLVFPLRDLVGGSPWLRYPLILPGIVAVVAASVFFRNFVTTLPIETRRSLITGAAVFFTGALGVETIGGWFDPELYGENVTYVLLATLEEGLEFAGIAIVLIGFVLHSGPGNREPATGNREPAIGNRQSGTGSRQPVTGSR